MNDIQSIIRQLRIELSTLDKKEGERVNEISEIIGSLIDTANEFESWWLGGWGQNDYNYYEDKSSGQAMVYTHDDFYTILEKQKNVDIEKIGKETFGLMTAYKKLQTHVLTELSPISDNDKFKNELELLKSIEDFRWGFESEFYIKMKMPGQIPVYDMNVLSRGIQTPPHFVVLGYLTSQFTKLVSVKNFSELVLRILRQLEIKLNISTLTEDDDYSQTFLKDVFDNFHGFYNQLRNRHANRTSIEIKDEYDVQDLIHSILRLHFKDVREEEYTPSYAGSSSRVDFLLKNENTVIEIKKTRDRLSDKEVGEQLILDVAHYKNHPNCKSLKCFVYDPENRIKNPRGIEGDIKKLSDENMTVELYVRP